MRIVLQNLRIYAYHGDMPQEQTVGHWYIVNLRLNIPDQRATYTDQLTHTVNYAHLYELVCNEMSIRSRLIEHVCGRTARHILRKFPAIDHVYISIMKTNPPIGAQCDGCGVELEMDRNAIDNSQCVPDSCNF